MTDTTNNKPSIRIALTSRDHRRRPRRRPLAALPLVTASLVVLAACGSDGPTAEPSSATAVVEATVATTTTPAITEVPSEPFRSALYGYVVTSLDWRGRSATIAWDGTGSPGDQDPTVDALIGPQEHPVWAMAASTTVTLDESVAHVWTWSKYRLGIERRR
jgi:hypothetical protein